MPRPIPIEEVLDTAVIYVLKRQVSGRPTTLRQLSKRIGLGVSTVRAELEAGGVEYFLITQEEDEWSSSAMEIAIRSIPENLIHSTGFTAKEVEESYKEIFGDEEPIDVDPSVVEAEAGHTVREGDPYYPYRISSDEWRKMKKELIGYPELKKKVMAAGYSGAALLRAVGSDRLVNDFAHPRWRPYVYQGSRYYKKEVLKHLTDLTLTYKERKKKSDTAESLANLMAERF